MLKINSAIMDLFYPVGTYYETSDTSFNPNTAWGGTWVEDTKGRVTVALDSEDTDFDTLGETGGSKYLQEHSHNYTRAPLYGAEWSGAQNVLAQNTSTGPAITATTNNAGTGDSGNLQPYIVVKRWHRTA